MKTLFAAVSCACVLSVFLSTETASQSQKAAIFTPDKTDSVLYSVAYYPEYMPYDRLDKANIVDEYKRPDQFITQDFSGGVHTNLDQCAIARKLDIVAENPYFATQARLDGRSIWLSDDIGRSLKHSNFLVTETDAQTIGWDSRIQYPQYPGQLRLVVYTHLAAGANMGEYWHWQSLHYGQETYWKGVLSHDLEPNRTYAEVSRVAGELKRIGPDLVDLKKDNKVAILVSVDSANAISYMPVSNTVDYLTVLRQMYGALDTATSRCD